MGLFCRLAINNISKIKIIERPDWSAVRRTERSDKTLYERRSDFLVHVTQN